MNTPTALLILIVAALAGCSAAGRQYAPTITARAGVEYADAVGPTASAEITTIFR